MLYLDFLEKLQSTHGFFMHIIIASGLNFFMKAIDWAMINVEIISLQNNITCEPYVHELSDLMKA